MGVRNRYCCTERLSIPKLTLTVTLSLVLVLLLVVLLLLHTKFNVPQPDHTITGTREHKKLVLRPQYVASVIVVIDVITFLDPAATAASYLQCTDTVHGSRTLGPKDILFWKSARWTAAFWWTARAGGAA